GHAPGNGMNSVFNCDAALLEHVGEFAHDVLRLCCCKTVTGYEDDFVRVSELSGDVIEPNLPHRSLQLASCCGRRHASESAEQDVGHRAVHRPAHQYRKYESGKTVE